MPSNTPTSSEFKWYVLGYLEWSSFNTRDEMLQYLADTYDTTIGVCLDTVDGIFYGTELDKEAIEEELEGRS